MSIACWTTSQLSKFAFVRGQDYRMSPNEVWGAIYWLLTP